MKFSQYSQQYDNDENVSEPAQKQNLNIDGNVKWKIM